MENEYGNVRERLVKYLAFKGITQMEFQKTIGASSGYVRNIVNTIGAKFQFRIGQAYPDLNLNWLLTGSGNMLNSNYSNDGVNGSNVINGSNAANVKQSINIDHSNDLYKQMLEMKDVIDTLKDKIAALRKNVFKASICPTVEEMKGRLNEILLEEDL